jgi:hypothetical protein
MPAYARRQIVDETEVGVYHCVSRCVRRAFLCGQDALTGRNFDHRKNWMQSRMEELASIFAVDVLGFSLMSNHIHVVLRNRPDLAAQWTDEQVVLRWCLLGDTKPDSATVGAIGASIPSATFRGRAAGKICAGVFARGCAVGEVDCLRRRERFIASRVTHIEENRGHARFSRCAAAPSVILGQFLYNRAATAGQQLHNRRICPWSPGLGSLGGRELRRRSRTRRQDDLGPSVCAPRGRCLWQAADEIF